MEFLEGLRLSSELLLEPLDGRSLVRNKELELQHLLYRHALPVVLRYLVRKEVHPVALREALSESGIEFRSGEGHHHPPSDMEGHHAVIEEVILPLGDNFSLPILGNEHGKLSQMSADEVPDPFFRTG